MRARATADKPEIPDTGGVHDAWWLVWVENVCAENTFQYYNNRDAAVPKADRPDF